MDINDIDAATLAGELEAKVMAWLRERIYHNNENRKMPCGSCSVLRFDVGDHGSSFLRCGYGKGSGMCDMVSITLALALCQAACYKSVF